MESKPRIVWAYCLYGVEYEKYYKPMIANLQMAIRCGAKVVVHTIKESEKNVRDFFGLSESLLIVVHHGPASEKWAKALRFLTSNYIEADYYFFKDSDSLVTATEIKISFEWMQEKTPVVLIMRDHPLHVAPIMAGMFAVNNETAKVMAGLAEQYFFKDDLDSADDYSYDQEWLARVMYPSVRFLASIYTSFFCYWGEKVNRIPPRLSDYGYVGAQAYRRDNGKPEIIPYLRLYAGGLLSLPYTPRLYFLYGRVRPSLFIAYALSRICGLRLRRDE